MRRYMAGLYGKKVLWFDGSSYVECPHISLKEWTIIVLCKPTEYVDTMLWGRLVAIGINENAINLGIDYNGSRRPFGSFRDVADNYHDVISPYQYTPNIWQTWIFTFKRPSLRLYHNDKLVAERTADADVISYTSATRIGWRNSVNIELFKGSIPVVFVYERELSEEEIARVKNDAFNLRPASIRDGLVLEFIPDTLDCANGVWRDNSGYGNHGTIYGARCIAI